MLDDQAMDSNVSIRGKLRQMEPVDEIVAARIRHLRKQRNITQQSLARALGQSMQQIQKYESGANRISIGRLFALSRAMGVSIHYFLDAISTDADFFEFPDEKNIRDTETLMDIFRRIRDPRMKEAILKFARLAQDYSMGQVTAGREYSRGRQLNTTQLAVFDEAQEFAMRHRELLNDDLSGG